MEWLGKIYWRDTGEVQEDLIFSTYNPPENSPADRCIFFHVKDSDEMRSLADPNGMEDFLVLSYCEVKEE